MTPEENIQLYEQDSNAEQKIRDAITEAYKNLEPEANLVNTYENEQFPAFYSALNGYNADTGLTDLDPLTLLQNAWGGQARAAASAQTARSAFDVRKAGMEDLIKTGVGQWATGYQGAQNAFDRWFQQEQLKEQRRQFDEQQRLAREQMGRASAGGSPINIQDAMNAALMEEAWRLKTQAGNQVQESWNANANAARNRTTAAPTQRMSTQRYTPASTSSRGSSVLNGYQVKPLPGKQTYKSSIFNRLLNNFRGIR